MSLIQKISTNFRIIIQKNSVIFWISEYFHYLCRRLAALGNLKASFHCAHLHNLCRRLAALGNLKASFHCAHLHNLCRRLAALGNLKASFHCAHLHNLCRRLAALGNLKASFHCAHLHNLCRRFKHKNKMIRRKLQETIEARMFGGKAIIIIGARQVGKSTLFKMILEKRTEPILQLNCDEPEVKEMLSQVNSQELKLLIGKHKIVMIDEAQRVENIGLTLKLITDNFPEVQLLVTGSSSFELQNKLNEPLTGRKFEYHLFPLSTGELLESQGLLTVKQTLENRLIYGSYPDVINHTKDAKDILYNLSNSYLYKDLLTLESIRRPALLSKLLTALALQVTSEVSYNELAQTVGTDSKTVEKYVDLLEKCYIIFKLNGFSRNLRTELKRAKKFYFYDNGIRNAILQNFAPLALRQDVGALWENFVISERIKANQYEGRICKQLFLANQPTARDRLHRGKRRTVYSLRNEMESKESKYSVSCFLPKHIRCEG